MIRSPDFQYCAQSNLLLKVLSQTFRLHYVQPEYIHWNWGTSNKYTTHFGIEDLHGHMIVLYKLRQPHNTIFFWTERVNLHFSRVVS